MDGERIASTRYESAYQPALIPLEQRPLGGLHRFRVAVAGADLRPGSGVAADVRTLVLAPAAPRPALIHTAPERARSLCGRRLDWVEARV